MDLIGGLWNLLRHAATVLYPSFRVTQIVKAPIQDEKFKVNDSYFELRICEQFLCDRREYWHEYYPLSLVLTQLIYDKTMRPFPFVVGPDLLKGLEELKGQYQVRYRNTRVLGPVPYRGDDVAIFVGLFRVRSRDWARQALSLLESFAKAFDSSKLSNYLSITQPLMDGIESFFQMGQEMQLRLGERCAFKDPEIHQDGYFSPGYFVIIRSEDPIPQPNNFWVNDGQLFFGQNKKSPKPYLDHDYVLYQIACLDIRNDYLTFDFHKQWEEVQNQIWAGSQDKAIETYQHLIALIRRCPDLIPSHMNKLAMFYRAKFQEEAEAYKKSKNPTLSIQDSGERIFAQSLKRMSTLSMVNPDVIPTLKQGRDFFLSKAGERPHPSGRVPLTEKDIEGALRSEILDTPDVKNIDPDSLMAALSLEMPTI